MGSETGYMNSINKNWGSYLSFLNFLRTLEILGRCDTTNSNPCFVSKKHIMTRIYLLGHRQWQPLLPESPRAFAAGAFHAAFQKPRGFGWYHGLHGA